MCIHEILSKVQGQFLLLGLQDMEPQRRSSRHQGRPTKKYVDEPDGDSETETRDSDASDDQNEAPTSEMDLPEIPGLPRPSLGKRRDKAKRSAGKHDGRHSGLT